MDSEEVMEKESEQGTSIKKELEEGTCTEKELDESIKKEPGDMKKEPEEGTAIDTKTNLDKNPTELHTKSDTAAYRHISDPEQTEDSILTEDRQAVEKDKQVLEESVKDASEPDEYEYTKREGFTSEIFKISITNLPKKFGFAEFKKKLLQLDLKPVKLKLWNNICFVTFRNEEDRVAGVNKVNGFKWKGHELKAVTARPAADPLMRKRRQEQSHENSGSEGKKSKFEDDGLSPSERLKNSVTPLWKIPYKDQLQRKQEEMTNFMKKYLKQIDKNCPDLRDCVYEWRKTFSGMPCELQDIKPSPETEGYRNKCEFTIGPGIDGETNVMGFRFGQYSQGTVYVGSPIEVAFLSDTMKSVVKSFQIYLSDSKYQGFNPENHSGHWRQLAVRTTRLGHIMAMVDFHPQDLSQEELEEVQNSLREYFTDGQGQPVGISSCYFRSHSERMTGAPTDSPYKLIFGDQCITERLFDMEFRISPNAFFQVNSAAAEVLYKQVSDWCNISSSSTVLDVCCGTGTIGLTVAKSVEKVIGVEMSSEAIEDAKINAENNGVQNVTYHCAKAEDVIKDITRSVYRSSDVIAIVDPPRSGLHSSVVVTIRNCRSINRLVYVSCNVNGALNNLIDLVRPTSKRLKGSRFLPVKAVPVDLFPHTNHCELVILFERERSDGDNDDDNSD